MPLPEPERRLLAAVAARLEAGESVQLPLEVEGLAEAEVIAAAERLDVCDPPVWEAVSVAEFAHPALVSSLTERGLREAGVWPDDTPGRPPVLWPSDGPFMAQVVRVLIASPSDVAEERRHITEVIHRWNADNAEATRTVLMPVRWETHATSEAGGHPQEIVNRQIVHSSDMLIGVFWTRLGTPTKNSPSGTVEEIEHFIDAEKPVSLFYSARPVHPGNIDQEQWQALEQFKLRTRSGALTFEFADLMELERMVTSALVRTVRERFGVPDDLGAGRVAAAPAAAVRADAVEGSNSRGQRTRRLQLENHGMGAAEQVHVELTPASGEEAIWDAIGVDKPLDFLATGGTARFPLAIDGGSPSRCNCTVRWRNEDGSEGMSQQTLTL